MKFVHLFTLAILLSFTGCHKTKNTVSSQVSAATAKKITVRLTLPEELKSYKNEYFKVYALGYPNVTQSVLPEATFELVIQSTEATIGQLVAISKDLKVGAVSEVFDFGSKKALKDVSGRAFLFDKVEESKPTITMELRRTGWVTGIVQSSVGADLLGADVFIPGTSFTAKTDRLGNFVLSGLPEGTWTIAVQRDGFEPVLIEGVKVIADQETKLKEPIRLTVEVGVQGAMKLAPTKGSRTVLADFAVSGKPVVYMLSEQRDFSDTKEWTSFKDTAEYTFKTDGQKTLYAKFANANGLESQVISESIYVDIDPPGFYPIEAKLLEVWGHRRFKFSLRESIENLSYQSDNGPCAGTIQVSDDNFTSCVGIKSFFAQSYGVGETQYLESKDFLDSAKRYKLRLLKTAVDKGGNNPSQDLVYDPSYITSIGLENITKMEAVSSDSAAPISTLSSGPSPVAVQIQPKVKLVTEMVPTGLESSMNFNISLDCLPLEGGNPASLRVNFSSSDLKNYNLDYILDLSLDADITEMKCKFRYLEGAVAYKEMVIPARESFSYMLPARDDVTHTGWIGHSGATQAIYYRDYCNDDYFKKPLLYTLPTLHLKRTGKVDNVVHYDLTVAE